MHPLLQSMLLSLPPFGYRLDRVWLCTALCSFTVPYLREFNIEPCADMEGRRDRRHDRRHEHRHVVRMMPATFPQMSSHN